MDIALLLLIHKALTGVKSQPPSELFKQNGRSKDCPPCPKPSTAVYQVPLTDVKKFKELEIPIPIEARDKPKVTPRPVTITIPEVSGEQLTNWWLEATQDIPVTSLPPGAR